MHLSLPAADALFEASEPAKALESVRAAIVASDQSERYGQAYVALKVDEIVCLIAAARPAEAVDAARAELERLDGAPEDGRRRLEEARRAVLAAGVRAVDALNIGTGIENPAPDTVLQNAHALWDQALWLEALDDLPRALDALARLRMLTACERSRPVEYVWARGSNEYAIVLGYVGESSEAIHVWEEVFARTSESDAAELRELGQASGVDAARELLEMGRWGDAVSSASRIRTLATDGHVASNDVQSRALNVERDALAGLGEMERAGALDEEIAALFRDDEQGEVRARSAEALAHRVWTAVTSGDLVTARDRLGRLEQTFQREQDPVVAGRVAAGVLAGATYAAQACKSRRFGKHDEFAHVVVAVHQRLIDSLRARPEIDSSAVVIDALLGLTKVLMMTGQFVRAIDRYEEVFGLSPDESEQLAQTLARTDSSDSDRYILVALVRAISLREAGETADAVRVMDELLTFFREQHGKRAKVSLMLTRSVRAWVSRSRGWPASRGE